MDGAGAVHLRPLVHGSSRPRGREPPGAAWKERVLRHAVRRGLRSARRLRGADGLLRRSREPPGRWHRAGAAGLAPRPARFCWIPATDTDIISTQHFSTGGVETAGPGCYDAVAIARTAGFPNAGYEPAFRSADRGGRVAPLAADPSQATGPVKRPDNQLHRARVLEVRIRSPPAASPQTPRLKPIPLMRS